MKSYRTAIIAALAIAGSAFSLAAQDGGQNPNGQRPPGGPGGPGGRQMQPPPLIAALDANHDGVIDANEIDNASAALRTLDKNGDGKLTMEELRPARPQGGGPDGQGRGQGQNQPRGPRGGHQGPPGGRPNQDGPPQGNDQQF